MYVEDDKQTQEDMLKILSYFFDTIYVASNGIEALETLHEKKIDILITDYDMPLMNGFELIEEVRSFDSDIQTIIISNYSDSQKLLNVIGLNLVDYLLKPINYDKIKAVLNKCAQRLQSNIILKDGVQYSQNSKAIITPYEVIQLSKQESIVFELLLSKRNNLVNTTYIEDQIFLETQQYPRIKSIMYRLRQKLPAKMILNVKDMGYLMRLDD